MPRAVWNGVVLAEADSDAVRIVEGNVYFPPESVDHSYLRESKKRTADAVKGVASYYDLVVEGEINRDAAWFYPAPKADAGEIAGYVAFWKGVAVEQNV